MRTSSGLHHHPAFKRVILILVLWLALVSCGLAQAPDPAFQAYWSEFRSAVMSGDRQKVAALTRFPFEVRGTHDSDPVVRLSRESFTKNVDRLLEERVHTVSGQRLASRSMREVIAGKPSAAARDLLSARVARVEQFEFVKVDDRWLFATAYAEEFAPAR